MLEAILGKVTYGKLLTRRTAKIVRIGGDYENELARIRADHYMTQAINQTVNWLAHSLARAYTALL